jgi:hypothetical protein
VLLVQAAALLLAGLLVWVLTLTLGRARTLTPTDVVPIVVFGAMFGWVLSREAQRIARAAPRAAARTALRGWRSGDVARVIALVVVIVGAELGLSYVRPVGGALGAILLGLAVGSLVAARRVVVLERSRGERLGCRHVLAWAATQSPNAFAWLPDGGKRRPR